MVSDPIFSLADIEAAATRVAGQVMETPFLESRTLSAIVGAHVFLKFENLQFTASFKERGALNKLACLSQHEAQRGVIAASAGNHAQGVAHHAQRLGMPATIVMPTFTPQVKIERTRGFGAQVVLHGATFDEARAEATRRAQAQGLTFIHAFDDPLIMAGQGTVALEMLRQQPAIDTLVVAVGGGGLIAGVASYLKAVRPEIKVVGVQTHDSDAMHQSVRAGQRVQLRDVGLFSDGTAVKQVGEETFRITRELVDDFVLVDTDEVCAAIKDVFEDTRSVMEPAGALGVAALKQYVERHGLKGRTLVAITCGANMNFDRLRFVAERAEFGERREALFAVTIPERPGAFKAFCELVGPRSVTEFNYRMADAEAAHVFVGLSVGRREEAAQLAQQFEQRGFRTVDLTDDELAKEHARHLVGGRAPMARDERLLRFIFPERPGALLKFLSSMNPAWNISLFHYRNQGADYGRVLVGLQIPVGEEGELERFLRDLDYPWVDETAHPVYRLFLR